MFLTKFFVPEISDDWAIGERMDFRRAEHGIVADRFAFAQAEAHMFVQLVVAV
jgi:hypothetical protein